SRARMRARARGRGRAGPRSCAPTTRWSNATTRRSCGSTVPSRSGTSPAPRLRTSSSSILPARSIGTTFITRRARSCCGLSGVRKMHALRISARSSSPRTQRSARCSPPVSPDTRHVPAPHEELRRAPLPNAMGHVVLAFAERVLRRGDRAGVREQLYRADEDRGFARRRRGLAQSREVMNAYPRYRDWITGSFLRQGDHANVVEYFADIPTNFRDVAELPPAIATHFAPLISGGPF